MVPWQALVRTPEDSWFDSQHRIQIFLFFFFKVPDRFLGHTQPPPFNGHWGLFLLQEKHREHEADYLRPSNAHFKNQGIGVFIPSCVLMLCTASNASALLKQITISSAKNRLLLGPLSPTRNQCQWISDTNQFITVLIIWKNDGNDVRVAGYVWKLPGCEILSSVAMSKDILNFYFFNTGKWPTWRTTFYITRLFQSSTCFEETRAHHQEVNCINTASGIVTPCKWPSSMQVEHELFDLHTVRPLTGIDYTRCCINTFDLLMMSTCFLETCRGLK